MRGEIPKLGGLVDFFFFFNNAEHQLYSICLRFYFLRSEIRLEWAVMVLRELS